MVTRNDHSCRVWLALALVGVTLVSSVSPAVSRIMGVDEEGRLLFVEREIDAATFEVAIGGTSVKESLPKAALAIADRSVCKREGLCTNDMVISPEGEMMTIRGQFPNGDIAVSPSGRSNVKRTTGRELARTTSGLPTVGGNLVGQFLIGEDGRRCRIWGVYENGDMALFHLAALPTGIARSNSLAFGDATCGKAWQKGFRVCQQVEDAKKRTWVIDGVFSNGDGMIRELFGSPVGKRMSVVKFQDLLANSNQP